MGIELKAPAGKTRVIGIDLFDDYRYLIGDFNSQKEAFLVADDHNSNRSGEMDDVFYVYDEAGEYIRGNEALDQEISP